MPEITLVGAVNMALARAMREDERVVVLGEDVGANGGVFRATAGPARTLRPGARDRHAARRDRDRRDRRSAWPPQGLRPVAEIQFMGFIYPAHRPDHQPRGAPAQPHARPAVLPAWCCARRAAPASTRPSIIRRAPRRCSPTSRACASSCPSSPQRAYGLLLAAIRDPDPVIFLEPTRLYRAVKEEVDDDGDALPLDDCFVLREGSDITLVTWGAMVKETLAAADRLHAERISAEVIDVATLKPLDFETILASVEKTGRCVIVHEAPLTGGFGAEIAARLAETGLLSLQAPVERVTGYDTVVPLFRDSSITTCRARRGSWRRRGACWRSPERAGAKGIQAMRTFNLPDLGEGLQEAEIVSWHVNPGDQVVADQPLVVGRDRQGGGRGARRPTPARSPSCSATPGDIVTGRRAAGRVRAATAQSRQRHRGRPDRGRRGGDRGGRPPASAAAGARPSRRRPRCARWRAQGRRSGAGRGARAPTA